MGRSKKATEENEIPQGFTSAPGMAFWKPEKEGSILRGVFLEARMMPSKKRGEPDRPVFDIVMKETGEIITVGGAALVRQFERIKEKSEVIIRYDGIKKLPKGHTVKLYQVFFKGALKPRSKESDK